MNTTALLFVSLPTYIWDAWPRDRTCKALTQDLLGIERRIRKGVSLRDERLRYIQLTERMETLSRQVRLEQPNLPSLFLDAKLSESFYELIGLSVNLPQPSVSKDATAVEPKEERKSLLRRLWEAWKGEADFIAKLKAIWRVFFGKKEEAKAASPEPPPVIPKENNRPFRTVYPPGAEIIHLAKLMGYIGTVVLPQMDGKIREGKLRRMRKAAQEVEAFLASAAVYRSGLVIIADYCPVEKERGSV